MTGGATMLCNNGTRACLLAALTSTLAAPAMAAGEASGKVAILKAGTIAPDARRSLSHARSQERAHPDRGSRAERSAD